MNHLKRESSIRICRKCLIWNDVYHKTSYIHVFYSEVQSTLITEIQRKIHETALIIKHNAYQKTQPINVWYHKTQERD